MARLVRTVTVAMAARPSIYYTGALPLRAGGELVNFQHVAALRRLGWRAFLLLDPASRVGVPSQPYLVPMVHPWVLPHFFRAAQGVTKRRHHSTAASGLSTLRDARCKSRASMRVCRWSPWRDATFS